MTTIFRQGDVLVLRDEGAPRPGQRVRREAGRVILAAGELTGHHHAIAARGAALFDLEAETDRLLRVRRPVDLAHEEHATIRLPAGDYRVRIQRTYTPEAIVNVAD